MTDPTLHGSIACDSLLGTKKFLTHTPLPEFWAKKYPEVTIFWWCLMLFHDLAALWDKWPRTCR